jgi:hypothetical protein
MLVDLRARFADRVEDLLEIARDLPGIPFSSPPIDGPDSRGGAQVCRR